MPARPTTLIKDAIKAHLQKDRAKVTATVTEIVENTSPSVAWLPVAEKCFALLSSPTELPTQTNFDPSEPMRFMSKPYPSEEELFEKTRQFRDQCLADFNRAVEARLSQLKQHPPKADALHALARLCVAKEMFDSPKIIVSFLVHGGAIIDKVDTALDF